MQAKTISGKNTAEIQSALEQCLSGGYAPTVAIVFMSYTQDTAGVSTLFNDRGIQVFGTTTAGEFINREINKGSIAVMLLDMNPEFFKLVMLDAGERSIFDISKQLGEAAKKSFSNPAIIVASTWLNVDGEEIIKGIVEGAGGEIVIFGGMSGDDLQIKGGHVFTNGLKSTAGMVALVVDQDKIEVDGIATCGWKAIGIAKTVTKSVGNIVYTIDDQPALDLVIKYLGLEISEGPSEDLVTIDAYYPLQLEREDAPPVMRTAMWGNLKDRSLLCAGNVQQGAKVRFSLPPDFDVIDTVVNECSELKSDHGNGADAVIMFSCISRYLSFGVMTSEEIERVIDVWKAPFIGFFSYGEYGRSKRGKHEFHNNTCCVVTLKEKNQIK